MPIYKIQDTFYVYKGLKQAEKKFRTELSQLIIEKFGRGPFEQARLTEIIVYSLNYYLSNFESICKAETSYTFYSQVYWFHEQVTEAICTNKDDENLPKEIGGTYLASYRRILKFIIESGCDVSMISGEPMNEAFRKKTEKLLDDLLFLGEMIMTCVDLYAEQTMIEDVIELTFDKNDLYVFSRRHHYEFLFKQISNEFTTQITKYVSDKEAIEDFAEALKNCFGIKYSHVGHIIASFHQELRIEHGMPVAVEVKDYNLNLVNLFKVPGDIAEQFFSGLRLSKQNKMKLLDLACKPYNLNRFLYKPIVVWNIDGKDYGIIGSNSWTEAIIQLTTNAIPWGKAPKEWLMNPCFKEYVHKKEDDHDKWLDDAVEEKLKTLNLFFDRNVKRINSKSESYNINVAGLGEIDFIIIAPAVKKIFVADCKHLLSRYDIANMKNDFNVFAVGSKSSNSYNATLAKKLDWFNKNRTALEEHFQLKYDDPNLSLDGFDIEGIFIVNSPTFYMYNAEYRIYTIDQVPHVLQGLFKDKSFFVYTDGEDKETFLNITYPFFKKPVYVEFDPLFEDNEDIE